MCEGSGVRSQELEEAIVLDWKREAIDEGRASSVGSKAGENREIKQKAAKISKNSN